MMLEIINAYGTQIARAILVALAGGLGTFVATLAGKYINTEIKRTVAKIAAQFAEQVWNALHGEDKMQKALEAAASLLKKYGIKFDATEMRILIEAAVGEFNEVFAKSWPVLEDMTDDMLRSVVQQMGYAYTEDMTREQMLAALEENAE